MFGMLTHEPTKSIDTRATQMRKLARPAALPASFFIPDNRLYNVLEMKYANHFGDSPACAHRNIWINSEEDPRMALALATTRSRANK